MAVIHFSEVTDDNLALILKQKTTGILIIIPKGTLKKSIEISKWASLQNALSKLIELDYIIIMTINSNKAITYSSLFLLGE